MTQVTSACMHMLASRSQVDLAEPAADMIDIQDVAQCLSRLPRFNGNTVRPYSVAEHSIMVFEMVRAMGFGPMECLQALMHDAAEMFTGDIPAPFKFLVPEIEEAEGKLLEVIFQAFGIDEITEPSIKEADWIAMYVEAKCLCDVDDLETWEDHDTYMPLADDWIEGSNGGISTTQMPHPNIVMATFHDIFHALVETLAIGEAPAAEEVVH